MPHAALGLLLLLLLLPSSSVAQNGTAAVPVVKEKCKLFDFTRVFPPGWPLASTNFDDLLCPNEFYYVEWFSTTRSIVWAVLFVVTIGVFFAMSCCVLPRMNGRKDTTGLCGKLGTAIQDRLDTLPKVLAWKRGRLDNWNGKLVAIIEHFSTSSNGLLAKADFVKMFTVVGDGFVDPHAYETVLAMFGTPVAGGNLAIDIGAIESIYSVGCRTWREKHCQVERDYERVKILKGETTHSHFLVATSSIGPQGTVEVEQLQSSKGIGGALKAIGGSSKAKAEAEAARRRPSVLAREGRVALAAQGGAAYASAIDLEFDIENAMTEAERFSVPLPSLYVETWCFALISAFLFLFLADVTRAYYLKIPIKDDNWRSFFTEANYFWRWVVGKFNFLFDLGHKVCIFHFVFIALIVIPSRLFTVLQPNSCCAKRFQKRNLPKALAKREMRSVTNGANAAAGVVGQEVGVNCIVGAGRMTLCDTLSMVPLYFLRDFCSLIAAIANLFGISIAVFIFFKPFVDFQQKELELRHVRISGISLAFAADPIDAYMRWLNLEIVDLLTLTLFKKLFKTKAKRMYLGFLDRQISWNCAPAKIPAGFDTSRPFIYFSGYVSPLEYLIQQLIYIPLLLCAFFPWPTVFAKASLTAAWKLQLSKYSFGGRQPRLGGVYLNKKGEFINLEGCKAAIGMGMKTGFIQRGFGIGCLEKMYETSLDKIVEWVVPPEPKLLRCNYILMPFPCDVSDEDNRSIDAPIPFVLDTPAALTQKWGFAGDVKMPPDVDPNALTGENIAFVLSAWVKKDKTNGRANAVALQTGYGCGWGAPGLNAAVVAPLIAKASSASAPTLTIMEFKAVMETLTALALDARAASPIFKRQHGSGTGAMYKAAEVGVPKGGRASAAKSTSNPLGGVVQGIVVAQDGV